MLYAASTNGFYDDPSRYPKDGPGAVPADAKEISDDLYLELMGDHPDKIIGPGADGLPALIDPPAPPAATVEDVEAARLVAYANPITGSDRHFAEATRLNAAGDTAGAQAATDAGTARYEAIRAELPWPEEIPPASKATK